MAGACVCNIKSAGPACRVPLKNYIRPFGGKQTIARYSYLNSEPLMHRAHMIEHHFRGCANLLEVCGGGERERDRKRQTDTHTHTHTERERERESLCVCVWSARKHNRKTERTRFLSISLTPSISLPLSLSPSLSLSLSISVYLLLVPHRHEGERDALEGEEVTPAALLQGDEPAAQPPFPIRQLPPNGSCNRQSPLHTGFPSNRPPNRSGTPPLRFLPGARKRGAGACSHFLTGASGGTWGGRNVRQCGDQTTPHNTDRPFVDMGGAPGRTWADRAPASKHRANLLWHCLCLRARRHQPVWPPAIGRAARKPPSRRCAGARFASQQEVDQPTRRELWRVEPKVGQNGPVGGSTQKVVQTGLGIDVSRPAASVRQATCGQPDAGFRRFLPSSSATVDVTEWRTGRGCRFPVPSADTSAPSAPQTNVGCATRCCTRREGKGMRCAEQCGPAFGVLECGRAKGWGRQGRMGHR